jgi:ELWxxDGT repeat protein
MKKAGLCVLVAAALAGLAHPGRAQGPVLVRDIGILPAYSPGSGATPPVRFKGEDYFRADDGFLGPELWATRGTLRSTRLVADICPGRCWGNPWAFVPTSSFLFFIAGNDTSGWDSLWLWRSDGTAAGTIPLVNLEIRDTGSFGPVSYLAPFRDGVVFVARDRARRAWTLWGSDGTRVGTRPIAALPGRYNANEQIGDYDWPRVQDDPQRHFFTWRGRLWATDGTAAGTGPAASPLLSCGGDWARLGGLVVYNGEAAGDPNRDCEPWVSDGTARGTRRLRDIRHDGSSYAGSYVAAGRFVYFAAWDDRNHRQLWQTDGTPRGTEIVRAPATRGLGKVTVLGAVGARLYFAADDGTHGVELWRTEGTPGSTVLVADLSPGPAATFFELGGALRLGDQMLFVAGPSGAGVALFRTRGTAESTILLAEYGLAGGSALSVAGNQVYFAGDFGDLGHELGVTDGTPQGTRILDFAHPATSADPQQILAGPGGLVFVASPGDSLSEIWRSGGHAEDTERFDSLLPTATYGSPVRLMPGSGGIFYYTLDNDQRLGWTDGRNARDLLSSGTGFYFPQSFVELGDRTLFFATRPVSGAPDAEWQPWVWSSDGTVDGTTPVAAADTSSGLPYDFRFGAALVPETGDVRYLTQKVPYFPERPSSLSTTDGTAAGTRALVPIPLGRSQYLDRLVAAGRFVFASFWNNTRASLWASDGTAEGTREVYGIDRPYDLSFISGLTTAESQMFFLGDDLEHGRELWASDGTPEGTRRVADLAPGAASSSPTDLAAFGGRVLFSADDGTHGRELWVSDGTAEGTRLLEILPGPRGSYPQAFQVVGDQVVFAADDGVHGLELWVTDGTPEGTRLAADVLAGPRSSSPRSFTVYGGDLFFNAGRPQEGYELWKLPLAALEP